MGNTNKDIISVTSEGQLTLPEKIRKELKIGKGSKLVVTMEKKYILNEKKIYRNRRKK